MAKDTAKKNIKSNASRLRTFLIITVAVNILWLLQPLFFSSSSTTKSISTTEEGDEVEIIVDDPNAWTLFQIIYHLLFWVSQEFFAYQQLYKAGQPEYDSMGNLQSCTDLSDPAQLGLLSYAQDLLWSCWALQLLTQYVSKKFWYLYWLIPIFAVYKIFVSFIKPMLGLASGALGGGQQQQQQMAEQQQTEKSAAELPQDAKSRLDRKRQELRK